jgi:hypothetical protein
VEWNTGMTFDLKVSLISIKDSVHSTVSYSGCNCIPKALFSRFEGWGKKWPKPVVSSQASQAMA